MFFSHFMTSFRGTSSQILQSAYYWEVSLKSSSTILIVLKLNTCYQWKCESVNNMCPGHFCLPCWWRLVTSSSKTTLAGVSTVIRLVKVQANVLMTNSCHCCLMFCLHYCTIKWPWILVMEKPVMFQFFFPAAVWYFLHNVHHLFITMLPCLD